jgi:YVTN family beta-propeller protein
VSVIDTESNAVSSTIPVGTGPVGVAVKPDGSKVYVAINGSNTVSVIDTASNAVSSTIPVGTGPVGVAVTPDGSKAYVAINGSNTVSVIDTTSNAVSTIPVGTGPVGVAVTPDGSKVYVAINGSNTVSVIDTTSNAVSSTIPVGTGPVGVAVYGGKVYVANESSNTVSVIDTGSNTVNGSIAVGAGPIAFGLFIGPPPKLNTTQIAHDLLGPAQRVYFQDLTTHANQPHLKIDKLGAGDFIFVDTFPGSNGAHSYEEKGLLISDERPANANGSIGSGAAVNGQNITIPQRFVLTATFIEPKKVSLIPNQPPPLGIYAAALPLSFGNTVSGATSQFRDENQSGLPRTPGQRLNVPFIVPPLQGRPDIAANLYNEVIDAQHPSPFTLVLHVERSASDSAGDAMLFVGDQLADSVHFNFGNGLTAATVFNNIQVGIGTALGTNYRASVYVTEFEIWAPNQP